MDLNQTGLSEGTARFSHFPPAAIVWVRKGEWTMDESGTLIVRVYAAQAEIPITGATVAVTRPDGTAGKRKLMFLRTTMESGETEVMTIPSPPRWESQAPMEQTPYAVCDIWVEHPDYVPALIENAQIFSGVETVQNVQLLPLAEWAKGTDELDVSNVTGQAL